MEFLQESTENSTTLNNNISKVATKLSMITLFSLIILRKRMK